MGKSGYLPDISSVFAKWRSIYLDGIASGNWSNAALALYNMNGALDDEYRLPISDKTWKEKEGDYIIWECSKCTSVETKIFNKGAEDEYEKDVIVQTTSRQEEIIFYDERCDIITATILQKETRPMWICPKCKNISRVDIANPVKKKYPEPHYRGCIYEQPPRPAQGYDFLSGIYPTTIEIWCNDFSLELEHRLAVYRLEYIQKNGEDSEDSGYKDTGNVPQPQGVK